MNLNFTIDFNDLKSLEGLEKIDKTFLCYLEAQSKILHNKLIEYRLSANDKKLPSFDNSSFLVDLAPYFDDFISELFFIEPENLELKKRQQDFDIIYECRRKFVQRVFRNYDSNKYKEIDFPEISKELAKIIGKITQKTFAQNVVDWLKNSEKFELELEIATAYTIYLVINNSSLPLFNIPRFVNPDNLIRKHKIQMLAQDIRLGFDYRDIEITLENALANAKYCIYCHHQQKDTCRFGIKNTKQELHHGCPLDQKISEMNELMSLGFNIGALSVILIDNPLVAATGHRICNDCMKACIFQKQDPVNIPLIESTILDNVLNLPYGVEIYILLTKWNPLNIHSPLPQKPTNYNILVTGLGPAGFALAYYLLAQGHNVTAIDGLKISPLEFDVTKPIKDYKTIKIPLSQRAPQGFGGVAEYGITNRWDKNNLTLVRLILERSSNSNFNMMGGIRLGSNITTREAFSLGFDHIALCLGAGKPKYINSDSYFLKGVKSAADFLMSLQQGGNYLDQSNSNLLLRMPVIVIGCGLTAIDSAVEAFHYYSTQVKKILNLYEQKLIDLHELSYEDKTIAEEFITHAKLLRQARSSREKLDILQQLGGVTICYRKEIKNSPAYKRNHEEIEQAKAIGVKFLENISPLEVKADSYGYANQIEFSDQGKNIITIPAKTILVAIGTEDNELQDINDFGGYDSRLSHFGDCNQKYSGSVVKALASAKNGYKQITEQLNKQRPSRNYDFQEFSKVLNEGLKAKVHSIKEISSDLIDLVIKSPFAARNYRPGQIFRLQNFAYSSDKVLKPLALSPYEVNKERGLIHFVISKIGRSTRLCSNLKAEEEVILMGPTGSWTNNPKSQTVILIGQGIRNMALLPIAREIKNQGLRVIFFAIYQKSTDIFHIDKIEKIADETHILVMFPDVNDKHTKKDNNLNVKITNELINKIKLSNLSTIPDVICYVTSEMLLEIKKYSQELFSNNNFICNILTPMQCMMKGICGQCVQKINDNKGYIFSCSCQEYEIKNFDPTIMARRLKQNSLLEKITNTQIRIK